MSCVVVVRLASPLTATIVIYRWFMHIFNLENALFFPPLLTPHSESSTATSDQPSVTSSTPVHSSGNGSMMMMKNGSGNVLHRVISLTTADSNLNMSRNQNKPPLPPTYIPEKLHISAYERFEGEYMYMCVTASLTRFCFARWVN